MYFFVLLKKDIYIIVDGEYIIFSFRILHNSRFYTWIKNVSSICFDLFKLLLFIPILIRYNILHYKKFYICFSGGCDAGYFCEGGAASAAPSPTGTYPNNGLCPPGHYCPAGTTIQVKCPAGTFRNSTGKDGLFINETFVQTCDYWMELFTTVKKCFRMAQKRNKYFCTDFEVVIFLSHFLSVTDMYM